MLDGSLKSAIYQLDHWDEASADTLAKTLGNITFPGFVKMHWNIGYVEFQIEPSLN